MTETSAIVSEYCERSRAAVLPVISGWVSEHASRHPLYELMLDYPMRPAKGLRPALCLATCRALGGDEDAALPTASVLELLHNAFLIHDDFEDGSSTRRGRPTLAKEHGAAVAVNVADGMLGLALVPLLHNTEVIGLGRALTVLDRVIKTVLKTVEGQALELEWVRHNRTDFAADDYQRAYEDLVRAKTAAYSFVAPVELGAIVAGASRGVMGDLERFADHMGVAFQITDDVLNLDRAANHYGKERAGDLWEGKRTLMLLHALVLASADDRARAAEALAKPRPQSPTGASELIEQLLSAGDLTVRGRDALVAAMAHRPAKNDDDVAFLESLVARHGGVEFARQVALDHSAQANAALSACSSRLAPGRDRDFLQALVRFVVERLR